MTGLHVYARDGDLPLLGGDEDLVLPEDAAVVEMIERRLLTEGSPHPVEARCVYARWKPGVSTTACFDVRFSDGEGRLVTYKRYAGSKAEHIRESFEVGEYTTELARPLRGLDVDAGSRVALFVFPTDREIVGLARLLTLRRTARFLRESGSFDAGDIRHRRSSAEVLRYKPERRAVVRLNLVVRGPDDELQPRVLAARALRPEVAKRVVERRRIVFSAPEAPPAPTLRGHELRPGILFEDWLELEEAPATGLEGARVAGQLLARLHAVGGAQGHDAATGDRGALIPLLNTDPELADQAGALESPPDLSPLCWIHGDFHYQQIGTLRGTGDPVLLDLDELRPGHPVEDLASWLADARAGDPRAHFESLRASLVTAYEEHGGQSVPPDLLASWTSFELLKRAAGCIRRLELGAHERAKGLLEAAHLSREVR